MIIFEDIIFILQRCSQDHAYFFIIMCLDESLRLSQQSNSSKNPHYYEDVFGELLDELKDSSDRYETLGGFNDYPKNFASATNINSDPPDIPPRRTSIRKTSHPRVLPKHRKPTNTSLIPLDMPQNVFDLPEEPIEVTSSHNSSSVSVNKVNSFTELS